MKRLNNFVFALVAAVAAQVLVGVGVSVADETERFKTWYRTELLVFLRTQSDDFASEQWDFEPAVAYPAEYRYLIDPELAERRRLDASAYESRIDEQGFQSLLVPAPVDAILDHDRPDAFTVPLDIPLDPNSPVDPNSPLDTASVTDTAMGLDDSPSEATDAASPNTGTEASGEAAVREVQVAIPYRLLGRDELEFTAQARSLRRRGHRIAFHGSWWAPLDDRPDTLPIALDRGADPDAGEWPDLQGSLLIYRSRYLHIALDLWLNTMGDYLPDGWKIEAPPLPISSIDAQTLRGEYLDPWAPTVEADPFASTPPGLPSSDSAIDPAELAADGALAAIGEGAGEGPEEAVYPWRHAIVHRQSRRMRSGEVHYLDHPVIGVIVKVTPVSEALLPYATPEDEEMQFRENHQLPTELLEIPLTELGAE